MEENKLGVMPVGKLIIRMSVPMMISLLIQALYNMVDAVFVSRISENALAAVSLAFPVQQLMIAISVGTGIGMMTVVSRLNGEGKPERANKAANVSVFLIVCYTAVFVLLGLTVIRPYFEMQTGDREIVEMGILYTTICAVFSLGNFTGGVFEKMLVGFGFSVESMISLGSGAVANMILDPLLIFGIGPFPEMGVAGAAVATVIGQTIGGCLSFLFTLTKVPSVKFRFVSMLPDRFSLKNIFAVAVPSMVNIAIVSVMNFGMNQILLVFSTTATAVFGIWIKVMNLTYLPVHGLNNGILPIVSFGFGAGKKERSREAVALGRKYALILELAMVLLIELIPVPLMKLFDASDTMLAMGITALRLCAPSLIFGAQSHVIVSAFQGLKHNTYSIVCTVCRQVVFLLPAAFLLSRTGNLQLVWLSVLIAEVAGLLLVLFLRRKVNRNLGAEWV